MKAFKKYRCCGQTYYTGIKTETPPVCVECGEPMKQPEVEIYRSEDNLTEDTKPVETYKSKEQYLNER